MDLKVSGFKRFMNTYEEVFYLVFKKIGPSVFFGFRLSDFGNFPKLDPEKPKYIEVSIFYLQRKSRSL